MTAERSGRLVPGGWSVAYRVTVYVDRDGQCSPVRTERCRDEQEARNFAVTTLLETYIRLVYPQCDESGRRLFWCEWTPGRLVDGQWEPDLPAGGDVDAAFLDGNGAITFDLAASVHRLGLESGNHR